MGTDIGRGSTEALGAAEALDASEAPRRAGRPDGPPAGDGGASIADLRLLECFVAVAEELSFGRAAERLGTGQPAVSRTIQLLERRLGVDLVRRDGGRLQLTAAGETLLTGSNDLVERHACLVEQIARIARSERASLTVAFDGGFAGLLLAAAVREYRKLAPEAEVKLQSAVHGASAEALLAGGESDFAIVGVPPADLSIRSAVVSSCRRAALLPSSHPLAGRRSLSLGQLEGERELRASGSCAAWAAQWSIAGLTRSGPSWGGEFELFVEALDLVASGHGLVLAPDVAEQRFCRPDLRWLPIDGLDPVPVHLAWRRRNVPRRRAKSLAAAFDRASGPQSGGAGE